MFYTPRRQIALWGNGLDTIEILPSSGFSSSFKNRKRVFLGYFQEMGTSIIQLKRDLKDSTLRPSGKQLTFGMQIDVVQMY